MKAYITGITSGYDYYRQGQITTIEALGENDEYEFVLKLTKKKTNLKNVLNFSLVQEIDVQCSMKETRVVERKLL